jgi:hypothetical protein
MCNICRHNRLTNRRKLHQQNTTKSKWKTVRNLDYLSDISVNVGFAGFRKGRCKWFNVAKGWGFVTPEDGSQDVFVHQVRIILPSFRFSIYNLLLQLAV